MIRLWAPTLENRKAILKNCSDWNYFAYLLLSLS
jgi:hypothetical protein